MVKIWTYYVDKSYGVDLYVAFQVGDTVHWLSSIVVVINSNNIILPNASGDNREKLQHLTDEDGINYRLKFEFKYVSDRRTVCLRFFRSCGVSYSFSVEKAAARQIWRMLVDEYGFRIYHN